MSGWTDDMTVQLPAGRTVAELVEFVLQSGLRGTAADEIDRLLVTEFRLSPDDAELARDRAFGGLVRAGTLNPMNSPDPGKDPVAWESFQRGTREPALVTRIFPELGPKQ